jgi:hypothetical protein
MGPAVGFALHRILQEALTNTVKHARATRIRCGVRPADRGLRLVFEDDGIGLPSPVPAGRGLGNMRRRIAALGGTLELSCPATGGARVDIWLPAPSHDHAIAARLVEDGGRARGDPARSDPAHVIARQSTRVAVAKSAPSSMTSPSGSQVIRVRPAGSR